MRLIQMVAGAAITGTLGATGIGLGSSAASASPCIPSPGTQCGGQGGPGEPARGEARGPGRLEATLSFIDFRLPGGPGLAGGGGGGGFGGGGGGFGGGG